MNLILLQSRDFIAAERVYLAVGDKRAEHIRNVLKAKAGDRIKVGALNGLLGNAEILSIDTDGIELHTELSDAPPPKLPLTLILALPRPKVLRRILRSIAEFGVRDLILLNTYKVEKSYWQSPALAPEAVRDYFIEGLQQSRDSVLPTLRSEPRFKPFVEDRLPSLVVGTEGLIAHPGDAADACPVALNRPCTLVIGPEGGFTPYEVQMLKSAGLRQIQIGTRILRVENALATLLARLFV